MKLLFITSTRLGDAILTTGALDYVLRQHPNCQVTVACGPIPAPLFEHIPQLEDLYILHKKSHHRHWIDLWRHCRGQKWDLIIDNRGSLVSYFLKTDQRCVWKTPKDKMDGGAVHRVDQTAHWLGLSPSPAPRIYFSETDMAQAQRDIPNDLRVLSMAPVANWIGKQWALENFTEIALRYSHHFQAKIAVFYAPHEEEQARPLLGALETAGCLLNLPRVSVREIGAYIQRSRLFIGNDSGLMHLAAAVKTPTIGLFGPSDERVYGPWSDGRDESTHRAVRTPETLRIIQKRPGFSYKQHEISYMENLTVDTVWKAVLLMKNV